MYDGRDSARRCVLSPELAEFILPYDRVRVAQDPDQLILDFYQSTYKIGTTLAGWDRTVLEASDPIESVSAGDVTGAGPSCAAAVRFSITP